MVINKGIKEDIKEINNLGNKIIIKIINFFNSNKELFSLYTDYIAIGSGIMYTSKNRDSAKLKVLNVNTYEGIKSYRFELMDYKDESFTQVITITYFDTNTIDLIINTGVYKDNHSDIYENLNINDFSILKMLIKIIPYSRKLIRQEKSNFSNF